ncbi:3-oxoacyl-ACP reductase [Chondromyces crocatus]|uniref:3-oxoacyl-ACP reductase n=2 Tax=Chondromyces crocatus TaxID=52 RepID=A0A0K1EFH2_CHOCO|nr:SDR family oxidoreductase [Chondromyces crocatus]AKT39589.1 3-oxoacyl-ACP reductase [Chondromyces crocatus]
MSTDKIALVTGGSRGLGKNTALRLAERGHDVVLTYQSRQADAEAVVAEIRGKGRKAVALALDTGKAGSFDGFATELSGRLRTEWDRGSFDFLINNAGIERNAPIAATAEEEIDALYAVHFKGVYLLTQKLLPHLSDGGRIVNFSSGLARFSLPGYAAYGSLKAAVEAFTRYLAKELGPRRINCNVLAPGAIDTDFTRPGFDAHPGVREAIASQTALGRIGEPDDIGGVVAFLCSEEARWINGQRIEASGGIFL